MNYITFNEIIEVNGLLEEKGLNFKVHLRDACGKQYFRNKGQKIEFDETKLNFFAV